MLCHCTTRFQRSVLSFSGIERTILRLADQILGHYKPGSNTAPIEVNDRISYAMPVAPGEELGRRFAKQLAEEDKDLIDGMEKAGFRTYLGQRETGVQTLGYTRNGGFYFDAGACAKIIDGSIKVEHGSIDQ